MIIPATSVPNSTDGNVLAPNSINAVWIRGNGRSTDLRFEVLFPGEQHELNTFQIYNTLTMNDTAILTVDPGIVVKFVTNARLDIHGGLQAIGTDDAPVVFTSYKDDEYGGDLNLDGTNTSPFNGDWGSIYLSNLAEDANCQIDYAVIRYGGNANSGMLYSFQADFPVSNSIISNSSTNGVRTFQASLTLTNNEVFGNSADGYRFESTGTQTIDGGRLFANFGDGIEVLNSVACSVVDAELFGNLGHGVRTSSNQQVAATGNWWGAVDGPSADGPGTGDGASGNIDYSGFLVAGSAFSYLNAGPNTNEGTITPPIVTQGIDTSEWGTGATTRMLYDLNNVILDYPLVDSGSRFELFITYYNPDNTTGVGGNIQRLSDGLGLEIHGDLAIPTNSPIQYHYRLPASSHADDNLTLNVSRQSGYRAVVSQAWLVERADTTDIEDPQTSITSPLAGTQLTDGLVAVTGTSTDGIGSGILSVEIGIDDGQGIEWQPVTQLRTDGSWTYRWNLPADGPYILHSRGRDNAGNLEQPGAGIGVVVNQKNPEPATELSAFDTIADAGGSIEILWSLSADDGGGTNDVTTYEIERREGISGNFINVGAVVSGIASFSDATTTDAIEYYFRVVSEDVAGNRTNSAIYGPVISIFNNGTDLIAPDNVTGFNGTPGNEFMYLTWTRSVDTDLDLVDQILDISRDNGVNWGISGPNYDAGDTLNLGKESNFRLVTGLDNGVGYLFRIRVVDSSGNISAGTVTGQLTPDSTAVTSISGTISADTTWAAGVFYISNNTTVSSGVTLTILPGVIVKVAANRSLQINGTLEAGGTAIAPIVFTAYTDDSFGGDSNGDGASSGTPGYWNRLYFENSANSTLENVVIRYGGSGNQGNIYMFRSPVSVLSSEVANGSSYGIYTYESSALIESNSINDNSSYGLYLFRSSSPTARANTISGNSNGIYVNSGATPTIDANVITGNTNYGIYYQSTSSAPEITGNTITSNLKPVRLPFSSLPGTDAGNTLSPNSIEQIEFLGNTLSRSLVLPANPVNIYYQVSGTATVATGVNLLVEPGIIWKFASGTRLDVNGALNAVGTEIDKIVFTSYRDDNHGGDTNGDGLSQGQPGDWNRLYYSDTIIDFLSRLEHCIISYGGSGNQGNVYLFRNNITVESCELSHSSSYGLYTYESATIVTTCDINDNNNYGWYIFSSGSPSITGTTIRDNLGGIYVQSSATPLINNNQILDNDDWGIYYHSVSNTSVISGNVITGNLRNMIIPASSVPNTADGNVLAPNGINGVWIRGNVRNSDLRFEVLFPGVAHEINTYQIYNTLTMNDTAILTVDPGVVVKFVTNARLDIHGGLQAIGTDDAPVVFTSYKDDEYGGDLNLDGTNTSPFNGDWGSIYLSNLAEDANCEIDHAVIRYGGNANSGMVYSFQTNFPISNSIISNSNTNGVRTFQASLTLTDNEVFGNSADGYRFESTGTQTIDGGRLFANFGDGIEVLNSVACSVVNGELFGNLGHGVRTSSNQQVTATGNWWGEVDGPGADGPGAGDGASGNIDFTGFLTEGSVFSYLNAGPNTNEGTITPPVVTARYRYLGMGHRRDDAHVIRARRSCFGLPNRRFRFTFRTIRHIL